MKTYKVLTLALAIIILIAACSPAATSTPQPKPTIAPTASGPNTGLQTRPNAEAWANAPQAALAARAMLVAQLSVDPDTIVLVSVDQMEWSDACLGVQLPGKMCAQVITSGYKIILSAKDQPYEFHTNADGSSVLQADSSSSGVVKPGGMLQTQPEAQRWAVEAPPAALAARADLMQKLSIDPDTIGLVSVEKIDWPDGCLGVIDPAKTCLAAVTPGYKIILSGGEKQYEYHTDETGSNLVLVNP
jgi:hypothetical protein